MIALRNTLWILLVTLICACSQMGVTSPTTFNEKLAIAYGTVTQVRTTATTLLKSGKIKADDAQNVLNQTDNARAGLDIARSMSGTDISTANGKLTAVETVLSSLSTYLSTKGN